MSKPIIVFCDFDGTITTKDSLAEFIKFYKSPFYFYCGLVLLSPILILFKLGVISNQRAKELLTKFYFGKESLDEFIKKATYYSLHKIDEIIIPKAINTLHEHKKNGATIVIVSASFSLYLSDWCKKNDFELLATELEIINDKITGKFKGKNCYGNEKVNKIKNHYQLDDSVIYAYGDTKGDLPMLELANYPFYRIFNN